MTKDERARADKSAGKLKNGNKGFPGMNISVEEMVANQCNNTKSETGRDI
jgi:hypothetical protein